MEVEFLHRLLPVFSEQHAVPETLKRLAHHLAHAVVIFRDENGLRAAADARIANAFARSRDAARRRQVHVESGPLAEFTLYLD